MKITIIGIGYVGLVTAACLAEVGHEIICVDIDKDKIHKINQGISPIYEEGLEKLICNNSAKIYGTTDYEMAYKCAEIIIIAVGTPEKEDGSADLSNVFNVINQITECVVHDCVVVIKSTVPIGTNDKIDAYIKSKLVSKVNIYIVSNPEFLSQGTAVKDTLFAQRIVIGVESKYAEIIMQKLYYPLTKPPYNVPILIMGRRSAEMVKYASNVFLALKVSYINEIANLSEKVNVNIEEVTKGMKYDSRIGEEFLKSGIGYGGSCFPKDTKALYWLSSNNNLELKTVKATIDVNDQQRFRLIKKARKYYDSFKNLQIAILGVTFKPGTDDIREGPALPNIRLLYEDGAFIRIWDPVGADNFKLYFINDVTYCNTIDETIKEADICFIFTDWLEIKEYDINNFKWLMKNAIIMDGRNCYDLNKIKGFGGIYDSIGRQVIS